MDILTICAVALTAAFAALAIRKYAPETSAVMGLAGGTAIFLIVLSKVSPLINEIRALLPETNMDVSYGVILLKTVGICALCQFTSDVCRDNGQAAIASRVELAAKLTIVLIALPMFRKILGAVSQLLVI